MSTVLVTGGSRGIGKAIVEKFEQEGANLLVPSRKELDLLDENSIKNYIQSHQDDIDVIINNAGVHIKKDIKNILITDFDTTLQINLKAPLLLVQGYTELMKEKRRGKIVNISSIWGVISRQSRAMYTSSKFALNGLTKALSAELAPYNILVNSVCPGFVETEMTKKNLTQTEINSLASEIPIKRFAKPHEIAEVVYFLGSDKNTYITGQNIIVDGGFTSC